MCLLFIYFYSVLAFDTGLKFIIETTMSPVIVRSDNRFSNGNENGNYDRVMEKNVGEIVFPDFRGSAIIASHRVHIVPAPFWITFAGGTPRLWFISGACEGLCPFSAGSAAVPARQSWSAGRDVSRHACCWISLERSL